MAKYEVREEGEFLWSEFDALDAEDAAQVWAAHDYSECDGWERDNGPYRVIVRGERADDCFEFEINREFEPTFYVTTIQGGAS